MRFQFWLVWNFAVSYVLLFAASKTARGCPRRTKNRIFNRFSLLHLRIPTHEIFTPRRSLPEKYETLEGHTERNTEEVRTRQNKHLRGLHRRETGSHSWDSVGISLCKMYGSFNYSTIKNSNSDDNRAENLSDVYSAESGDYYQTRRKRKKIIQNRRLIPT